MANRKTVLATGEYYHVFNRGVARQPAFLTQNDYEQVVLDMVYYRVRKPPVRLSRFKEQPKEVREKLLKEIYQEKDCLVDVVAYVFMPNHFHLLLQQSVDKGISTFVSRFTNSYTKYFNTKRNRVGPIFQGVFKSVHIESNEQLLHLSRYIHLNPVTSFVVEEKNLFSYRWSSLPEYLSGDERVNGLATDAVLGQFASTEKYKEFLEDRVEHRKQLEGIKHLLIEVN